VIKRTRLSCRSFVANTVRLHLHALAYNLGNFLRTLVRREPIEDWQLTSLKEKLIKIGAKVVGHGLGVGFRRLATLAGGALDSGQAVQGTPQFPRPRSGSRVWGALSQCPATQAPPASSPKSSDIGKLDAIIISPLSNSNLCFCVSSRLP
jgi:hypothetical protein